MRALARTASLFLGLLLPWSACFATGGEGHGLSQPAAETFAGRRAPALEEILIYGEPAPAIEGAAGTRVGDAQARDRMAKDTGELLDDSAPGLAGRRTGGIGVDPVIRGFKEDRVNVTIDGTRIWGGGPFRMDPPTSLLDVEEIEEIQVVRGPYDMTLGPPGLGGAIRIATTRLRFTPRLASTAAASYGFTGNFDGSTIRSSLGASASAWAFRVSAGYRNFGDYRSGGGKRIDSGFENRSFAARAAWQPAEQRTLEAVFTIDSDRNAEYASLPLTAEEDDAYTNRLRYRLKEPCAAVETVEAAGYFNYVHHRMTNRDKPTREMMRVAFPLDARTYGGALRVELAPLEAARLVIGGDVYRLEREGTNRVAFVSGPKAGRSASFDAWPRASATDGGLFAQLARPLGSKWRVIVGGRVDFVGADADPTTSGRAAYERFYGAAAAEIGAFEVNASADGRLVYRPAETLELFLSAARAVRTADATERFFALAPGPGGFFVGNPALSPEAGTEIDSGVVGEAGPLTIDAAAFHRWVDDFILPSVIARMDVDGDGKEDVVRGFRNIDFATSWGVDAGVALQLLHGLALEGSLSYVLGENQQDDKPLPEVPPLEGTVGLRYENRTRRLWVNPTVRLVSGQRRVDKEFGEDASPGFVTADLYAGFRVGESYEFRFGLSNLFDKNYHEHLTREDPFSGVEVPEPGRVTQVGVRATF